MLAHVVDRHAEEVALLWELRRAAATSPSHSLASLLDIDERIEAHLDGLRIAGDGGWDASHRLLDDGDEGEFFGAAVQAFAAGAPRRADEVLDRATASGVEEAVVAALVWLPYADVAGPIEALLEASPARRRVGLAAASAHRRDPGGWLARALFDADAAVRMRALRAAGELGRTDLLPPLLDITRSEQGAARLEAAWSAALLGAPGAAQELSSAVLSGEPSAGGGRAVDLAVRVLALGAARALVHALACDASRRREALLGAAALGETSLVPWIIECAATPALARAAGLAFSMITGADLAHEGLVRPRTSAEEDGDTGAVVGEDRLLVVPDAEALRALWASLAPDLLRGVRYLRGKPVTGRTLGEALAAGRQPERASAAMELALRRPGAPLFDVSAPAARQVQTAPL